MSFLLAGPIVFLDPDDLELLVLDYSDRVRREPLVARALARLIGNNWADAEHAAANFLHTALFADGRPKIDVNSLARAVNCLDATAIDALVDMLLESALATLPLHSAALISSVGEELGRALTGVVGLEGQQRQKQLLRLGATLSAGALKRSGGAL